VATNEDDAGGRRGLLLIGHGSRRSEANAMLAEVTDAVRRRLGWHAVEAAYLEIARPTIAEGFKVLVREGCTSIVVHPYFLYPGNHTFADIPRELERLAAEHPDVHWSMTEPLNFDSRIVDVVVDRVAAATTFEGDS
jgi:sirohydrochlorin ferrochelatase